MTQTLKEKIAEAVESDFYAIYRGDRSFDDTAEAILSVIAESVVPLDWKHAPNEPQGYTWRAKKPFGSSYYIHERNGKHSWGSEYVSLSAAKAAAQADYTRRILSAIGLSTPEQEKGE